MTGSSTGVTSDRDLARLAWAALERVFDPEIPTVSVLDLGMIRDVKSDANGLVVELMPTFLGCPAISMIRQSISVVLAPLGPVRVELVRDQPWSSQRISERGRRLLRESGFAPPPRGDLLELTVLPRADCPYCGSVRTVMESVFGPTPCRAIHYCRACRQPFEQFKAV